ncbi:hypothetical protein SASPL_133771 [Salvia splendens]|uniref:Uncharacterized protein n=1 Tax=Salvia splendens TaxID=180675 RepID=A0A8X8ZIC4_SALSN|nr:hypothetical protein SASPL_133771 [Salvia splendens]
MVVGFISLTLTFGEKYITSICIPEKIGDTMLPCELRRRGHHGPHVGHHRHHHGQENQRRLLWYEHRVLAADSVSRQCERGYVPLISSNGVHQLHIFIFFLAVFHVLSSAITMRLGRVKIREWKAWEKECEAEYEKNVGTKLQAIISRMAIEIQERHAVVQRIPLVQLSLRYINYIYSQMGSHMKRGIFDDQTSKALKSCHKKSEEKQRTLNSAS